MRASIAALVTVLAVAVAGCGSSGSSGGSSGGSTSGSGSSSSGASSSGGTSVSMQNIQFSPKSITVKVGQKITWTNKDSVAHNVTATQGASFKSPTMNGGATFSFTPTKAGTISYVCTLHPGMSATITVTS